MTAGTDETHGRLLSLSEQAELGGSDTATRDLSLLDVCAGVLLWIPGALLFFRRGLTSGFDKVIGESGDARLQVFLHEHWLQALRGEVAWRSPEIFYPVRGTLGYSDTFVLDLLFYIPLRVIGMDPFLAFEWTIVLLTLLGFVGMFCLLRHKIGLGVWVSAALATLFTFSNNIVVKWGHPQLYAVYWLPLLLWLLIGAATAHTRGARVLRGSLAGALMGLLLSSTYYVAWFSMLGGAIFVTVLFVLRWRAVSLSVTWSSVFRRMDAIVASFVGLVIGLIPFALTYLPVLRSTGGRTYDDAMQFAPHPSDMVNLGPDNYLWGSTMRRLIPAPHLGNTEVSLALTPIVMALVVASGIVAVRRLRQRSSDIHADVCIALTAVVAMIIVLPVKFGFGSLWIVPWTVVPGAVGIRAIGRIAIVAGFFATLAIAMGVKLLALDAWVPKRRRDSALVVLGVVLVAVVFEQFNVVQTARIDRSDELRELILAPDPPQDCQSFFIVDTSGNTRAWYETDIDAMLIAQHFKMPTLNGYSGQFPENYRVYDPTSPDYRTLVSEWASAHGVARGLCSYDRATHSWSTTPLADST